MVVRSLVVDVGTLTEDVGGGGRGSQNCCCWSISCCGVR